MIRICLFIAIVVALAAGALNIVLVKDKIATLAADRNTQRDQRVAAEGERDKAKKAQGKAEKELTQAQQELTDTKAEHDKAVATAKAQQTRADDLSVKLEKTTQEREDARNKLAQYEATSFSPDQIGKLGRLLKDTQEALEVANQEKVVLQRASERLQAKLDAIMGRSTIITMNPNLKGKILVVDPKWDFVVLNIGQEQGLVENGELLVSRDGKLVSKVVVRSIERNRSIANVVPGWKIGEVFEGDVVTPAHPAS